MRTHIRPPGNQTYLSRRMKETLQAVLHQSCSTERYTESVNGRHDRLEMTKKKLKTLERRNIITKLQYCSKVCATIKCQSRCFHTFVKLSFRPGLRSRIPNNTGSRSRIFFVRLRLSNWIIFYITLQIGNSYWNGTILLKLLLKQIFCCAPRCPLILTVKFHSLHVKESESEISESRCRKFYLRLRNPGSDSRNFHNQDY